MGGVLHYLRCLVGVPAGAQTDRELLHAFAGRRDETAFAAVMDRHGPLVWGVCRRLLRDEQDAEDAFQATFLVLARKAGSVPWREDAGNWLYAVALRVARKARAQAQRRRRLECEVVMASRPAAHEGPDAEVSAVVAEEVGRLPDKYRRPVVLCCLQGKSYAEAALLLGWPEGTVSGRLARARELLRRRLTRRGLALPASGVVALLAAGAATTAAPAALVQLTTRAALTFATGQEMSSAAAALAEEVLRAMSLSKVKMSGVLLLALAAIGTGLGVWAYGGGEPPVPRAEQPPPRLTGPKAGKPGLPAAWAGRWVADPFAGAESIEVRHSQTGSGVPRVYQIQDAKAVAAVVKAAKITGIRNDVFVGCIPTARLIVRRRDGTTFPASFAGDTALSCDTGMFTVDDGFITALNRAVSDLAEAPVNLMEFLPAPPGTFIKPAPPPSPKSLATGFTSLEVTFAAGGKLHRTRITDEKTLDTVAQALAIVKVEPLPKEPVEVCGVHVVCKDKAVFRLQFRARERLVDNDVGQLRVTPAFVAALNKVVSKRAGSDIDVVARNNPLADGVVRRSAEFRKLLEGARSLRYTEKRDGRKETVVVDDPKELAEIVNRLSWVEATPRELKLPKEDRSIDVSTKDGRTVTLQFLQPGINYVDAEAEGPVPFLGEIVEVPGIGQVWIDNQWHGRFADLGRERQRKAKERRDAETSGLVCRDLPAFCRLVVSVSVSYRQGKQEVDGILPAEDGRAVLALLAAGTFEPLDWSEERWEKELGDLEERGPGEIDLTPGLGYHLSLVVTGEKEMVVPMCGRLTFTESPLSKLRKAIDADKADSVELLPRPKG